MTLNSKNFLPFVFNAVDTDANDVLVLFVLSTIINIIFCQLVKFKRKSTVRIMSKKLRARNHVDELGSDELKLALTAPDLLKSRVFTFHEGERDQCDKAFGESYSLKNYIATINVLNATKLSEQNPMRN